MPAVLHSFKVKVAANCNYVSGEVMQERGGSCDSNNCLSYRQITYFVII